MNKPAAIYARVSSDRQKENHTIGSQTSALVEYAQTHGYAVPSEWVFQDEGYSGTSLIRPGLEALRDLAAQGQIVAVLIYSPDRLSRTGDRPPYADFCPRFGMACNVGRVFGPAKKRKRRRERI